MFESTSRKRLFSSATCTWQSWIACFPTACAIMRPSSCAREMDGRRLASLSVCVGRWRTSSVAAAFTIVSVTGLALESIIPRARRGRYTSLGNVNLFPVEIHRPALLDQLTKTSTKSSYSWPGRVMSLSNIDRTLQPVFVLGPTSSRIGGQCSG
jgi:hypothetical protein